MSIPRDAYIGEPKYPAPWTTSRPREGLRDNDAARIVSLAPDVCRSPKVPVPYPVVDFCGHDANYTPSVRFTEQKAMVLRSHTTHVHGDEPGVGKGVKSGTVGGISEPIGHAPQVRAEGSPVIRHLDRFHMNNRNTVGEAIFVRDMGVYPAPKDTDPVRGSLRLAQATSQQPGVVLAQAAPDPAPRPRPAPAPAPRPPGQVIRPNVPQWTRPPPVSPTAGMSGWAKLARIGRFGGPLSLLFLDMRSTPTIPHLGRDADAFERDLNRTARDLLDPFDATHNDAVRDWYHQELEAYRRRRDQPTVRPADPAPVAVPEPGARIAERERYRRRCEIDAYSRMRTVCPRYGMQAHHIVPDWTLRYGSRNSADRIPNMPSLGEGMAICVVGQAATPGSEHNEAHFADGAIEALGANTTPPNTATVSNVTRESIAAMARVRPDCAAQIAAAVAGQFGSRNPNQLLRAKRLPPLHPDTIGALESGAIRRSP